MSNELLRSIGESGSRDRRGLIVHNIIFEKVPRAKLASRELAANLKELGLVEVGERSWSQRPDGLFRVTVRGEGVSTEDGASGPEVATYEFTPAFKDETIESHPFLAYLMQKFGGTWDTSQTPPRVKFAPRLRAKSDSVVGLFKTTATGAPVNPMSGVETWKLLGGVFKKSYVSRTLPSALLDNIGRIIKQLPDGFPTPAGRDWLVLPAPWRKRGEVFDISEEYEMSKPGGWDPGTSALLIRK